MSKAKIGVVLSTTRTGRFADKVASWVLEHVATRQDLELEPVDLRDYPLPFFDEAMSPLWATPTNTVAQRWTDKIAGFDGYIFVTAEYNHSVPRGRGDDGIHRARLPRSVRHALVRHRCTASRAAGKG